MSAQLNHTIVMCRDKEASAGYLTRMPDLPRIDGFQEYRAGHPLEIPTRPYGSGD